MGCLFSFCADDLAFEFEAYLGVGVPSGTGHTVVVERHEVSKLAIEAFGIAKFDNLVAHFGYHQHLAVAMDVELVDKGFVVGMGVEEESHLPETLYLGFDGVGRESPDKVARSDNDIALAEL